MWQADECVEGDWDVMCRCPLLTGDRKFQGCRCPRTFQAWGPWLWVINRLQHNLAVIWCLLCPIATLCYAEWIRGLSRMRSGMFWQWWVLGKGWSSTLPRRGLQVGQVGCTGFLCLARSKSWVIWGLFVQKSTCLLHILGHVLHKCRTVGNDLGKDFYGFGVEKGMFIFLCTKNRDKETHNLKSLPLYMIKWWKRIDDPLHKSVVAIWLELLKYPSFVV